MEIVPGQKKIQHLQIISKETPPLNRLKKPFAKNNP